MTADETAGNGTVNYAVSTDDRTTWLVNNGTDGVRKIAKNNSGTWQYNNDAGTTVTVGYDFANGSYTTISPELSQNEGFRYMYFKPDGTKVWVGGMVQDTIFEYDLGTEWDLSSISYGRSKSFSTSSQSMAFYFRSNGSRAYLGHYNGTLYQLNLNTAWNISTQSTYQSLSLGTTTQGIFFKPDGAKFYSIDGSTGRTIKQFGMTSDWDITTASVDHTVTIPTDQGVTSGGTLLQGNDIWFSSDGTKFFCTHYNGGSNSNIPKGVAKYSLSTAWDISSTITYIDNMEFKDGSGNEFSYIPDPVNFNSDGTKMFVMVNEKTSTSPGRRIVEYSTGGTEVAYGTSETWVNSTTNNELSALQQALSSQSVNRMDKTQLDAVPDANHFTLGNSLDLMIAVQMASGSTVPKSDGVSINYDAATLVRQAAAGTDYEAEFPSSTSVKIKSLAAQNLKVRVI
jgi:hypothetical protein